MRGVKLPLPQYVSMAWCLIKHRDSSLYLYLESVIIILERIRYFPSTFSTYSQNSFILDGNMITVCYFDTQAQYNFHFVLYIDFQKVTRCGRFVSTFQLDSIGL